MGTIVGFNRIYKQLYVCINVNIYFEGILDAFFFHIFHAWEHDKELFRSE